MPAIYRETARRLQQEDRSLNNRIYHVLALLVAMDVEASNSGRVMWQPEPTEAEIECRAWILDGGTACPPRIPPSPEAMERAREDLSRDTLNSWRR